MAIMLIVLVSAVLGAAEPEVSETLGRQMQNRAKQVFEFCDKDKDGLLNANETLDADKKIHKILESMAKDRKIGGKRIPPTVDEPLYANPDQITQAEFVQHFQAEGTLADAKARAIQNSKPKVVFVPVPVQVPVPVPVAVAAPKRYVMDREWRHERRYIEVASTPMSSPNVFLNPHPVIYPQHHQLNHMHAGAMQAPQSIPVFAAALPVAEHQFVNHDHNGRHEGHNHHGHHEK